MADVNLDELDQLVRKATTVAAALAREASAGADLNRLRFVAANLLECQEQIDHLRYAAEAGRPL